VSPAAPGPSCLAEPGPVARLVRQANASRVFGAAPTPGSAWSAPENQIPGPAWTAGWAWIDRPVPRGRGGTSATLNIYQQPLPISFGDDIHACSRARVGNTDDRPTAARDASRAGTDIPSQTTRRLGPSLRTGAARPQVARRPRTPVDKWPRAPSSNDHSPLGEMRQSG